MCCQELAGGHYKRVGAEMYLIPLQTLHYFILFDILDYNMAGIIPSVPGNKNFNFKKAFLRRFGATELLKWILAKYIKTQDLACLDMFIKVCFI